MLEVDVACTVAGVELAGREVSIVHLVAEEIRRLAAAAYLCGEVGVHPAV